MRLLIVAFAVATVSAGFMPGQAVVDEKKEPVLKLTLFVDGKPVELELGKEVRLNGEFRNPKIKLQAAPTRDFTYGGIRFQYPSNFTWEADFEGAAYHSWTMSGNDSTIMFFRMVGTDFTPDIYATGVAQEFGEGNSTTTDITRTLGRHRLKGKRVVAQIAGSTIVQDALEIPTPAGRSRLLVLQDVAPELTPRLREPKQVLDLLKRTFDIGR